MALIFNAVLIYSDFKLTYRVRSQQHHYLHYSRYSTTLYLHG